jgi:rSAM/selenodomain-associated transferase 2
MTDRPDLAVVIPTLNAAPMLAATLDALRRGAGERLCYELIVADGGSHDATHRVAAAAGARVSCGAAGRGAQLRQGAEEASARWLLFLHADSRLAAHWGETVMDFMARRETPEADGDFRAAVFGFALDDADARARRIEHWARWRARVLGLPYGDQGLLISQRFYRAIGGYRPIQLMEDVDLARRIGRRRLELLEADAVTSAVRYRRDGWVLRPLRNLSVLALYFLGFPPRLLARLYG